MRPKASRRFSRSARRALEIASGAARAAGRALAQREVEGGAAVRGALGPHLAAVPAHDALHDREPHAGAFVFLGGMEALEYAKQPVGVAHVEAHAVVAHVEHGFALAS